MMFGSGYERFRSGLGPGMVTSKTSMISTVGPGRSGWSGYFLLFSVGPQKRHLKDHNIGVYEKVGKQPGPTRTTRTQSRFLRVCGRPHTRTLPGPTWPEPGPRGLRSRRDKNHAGLMAAPMGKIGNASQTTHHSGPGRALSANGAVPVGAVRMWEGAAHDIASVRAAYA